MRRWAKPAEGFSDGSPVAKRVAVTFDDETFNEVRSRALKAGTSFAEQARQLVEFGLETVRSSERRKPGE